MAIDTWHFYIRNLLEKKKKDLKEIAIGSIGWLGNEGILYDSGEKWTQGKGYSIQEIREKIPSTCSALKYVFILLESGGAIYQTDRMT